MRCAVLLLFLAFVGCREEGVDEPTVGAYASGVFLVAEGVFNQSSGTVHHYKPDTRQLSAAGGCIFRAANGRDLGNVVQSLAADSAYVYVVVNNADKIEVVRRSDWQELGQILDVRLPRYACVLGDSLLVVSQWGEGGHSGELRAYRLPARTLAWSLNVPQGAERMASVGGRIWLAHVGGYAAAENKLSIVDVATGTAVQTLTLGYENANSLYVDAQRNWVWVLCAGRTVYSNYPDIDTAASTAAALVAYDAADYSLQRVVELGIGEQANNLHVYGQQAYWLMRGGVYAAPLSNATQASDATQLLAGNFYGLGLDSERGELYASRNRGVNTARTLRYSLQQAAVIDSIEAGVFVNGSYAWGE